MNNQGSSCQAADSERHTYARHTCGGCEQLKRIDIDGMGIVFGCRKTECVVPQHVHRDSPDKRWEVIFWRVPLECPLPDSQVVKSAQKAPQKYWVKEQIKLMRRQ